MESSIKSTMVATTSQPPVIILWDYENCAVPVNITGQMVARQLTQIGLLYGCVKSISAYGPVAVIPSDVREQLQISGVRIIDGSTTLNRKDVADKLIITDMFLFALDHPPPATIILIAGDVDYTASVAALKMRGYQFITVYPPRRSRYLYYASHAVIDWYDLLIGGARRISQPIDIPSADSSQVTEATELMPSLLTQPNSPTTTIGILGQSSPQSTCPIQSSPQSTCPIQSSPPSTRIGSKSPSSSSSDSDPTDQQDSLQLIQIEDVNTLDDFLRSCISIVESDPANNNKRIVRCLSSRVGVELQRCFPSGWRKGHMKTLIQEAVRLGYVATEGEGGYITIVMHILAIRQALGQKRDS